MTAGLRKRYKIKFTSWQDTKMIVVADGVKVFVVAVHVQKCSDTI